MRGSEPKDNPGLAKFQFRAANEWINGGHNRTTIKDFYGAGQKDTMRQQTFAYDNGKIEAAESRFEGDLDLREFLGMSDSRFVERA